MDFKNLVSFCLRTLCSGHEELFIVVFHYKQFSRKQVNMHYWFSLPHVLVFLRDRHVYRKQFTVGLHRRDLTHHNTGTVCSGVLVVHCEAQPTHHGVVTGTPNDTP